MSVNWTPSGKTVPVAEYRSMDAWRESKRYREIVGFENEEEFEKVVKSFNKKPEKPDNKGEDGSDHEEAK